MNLIVFLIIHCDLSCHRSVAIITCISLRVMASTEWTRGRVGKNHDCGMTTNVNYSVAISNVTLIRNMHLKHSHFCEWICFLCLFVGELEHVLNLGQVSGGQEKKGPKNGERMQTFQWTIQRIRLSPQEKHLAATLKANHREELRLKKKGFFCHFLSNFKLFK